MLKNMKKTFQGEHRVTTPTATESVLPWKRMEDDKDDSETNKQTEFPSWANNKVCSATSSWNQILSEIYFPSQEYLAYSSPSATFLGKL